MALAVQGKGTNLNINNRLGRSRPNASRAVMLSVAGALVIGFQTTAPVQAAAATVDAPVVTATVNPPTGTYSCVLEGSTPTVVPGSVCSFTISPSPQDTAVPAGYSISQVGGEPVPITAADPGNGDTFNPATGVATISVIMDSWFNTLYVSEIDSDGVPVGYTSTVDFQGALRPQSVDGDLNDDGVPDLLMTPSPGSAVPPGLWMAAGNADGTVNPTGIDLGGSYASPGGNKSSWDGVDAVSGDFCGNNEEDVLAYNPGAYNGATNPDGGGGAVMCGDGSTDALDLGYVSTFDEVDAETFQDANGNDATQLVNAGNTSGNGTGIADLLATINNQLFLFSAFAPATYGNDSFGPGTPVCTQSCAILSDTPTPDGTYDWDSWTLATTQINGATAMYLWNPTTGALDLWTGLTATDAADDGVFPDYNILKYTQYTIAAGGKSGSTWNKSKTLELHAADFGGGALPGLWATNPATGKITTYLATLNGAKVTLSTPAGSSQTLITPANSWVLNDRTTGSAGIAQDGGSADTADTLAYQPGAALPLTGDAGVTWNTGDRFSPDAAFDGATGYLTSNGPALTPDTDFTVSAWVKPAAAGGTVFSQSGTDDSSFFLSAAAHGQWEFGINTGGTTSSTYQEKAAGSYQLGSWERVTLTYSATGGALLLFVNGVRVGAVVTATPPAATGNFVVGADQNAGALGSFFSGQISQVETWNSTLTIAQVAGLS